MSTVRARGPAFFLENLTPEEVKDMAELYEGGNQSRLINIALEFYKASRKSGDKGLEKFIRERAKSKS